MVQVAFTVLAYPPLIAAGVSTILVWAALRHREDPVARTLAALMVLIALWSLTSAMAFLVTDRTTSLLLQRVESALGGIVPAVWVILTVRYAGLDRWLTRRSLTLLAIDPLVFSVLVLSNPYHGLVWRPLPAASSGPVVALAMGPVFYIHLAVAYSFVLLGIGILGWVGISASRIHRRQAMLLALGAIVPLTVNAAFTFGYSPIEGIDLTTVSFTVTGAVFALALFRYDLLDITPIAHRNVLDVLGDGSIILDSHDRIVEVNSVAARILHPTPTVGDHVSTVLPVEDDEAVSALDGEILSYQMSSGSRQYEIRLQRLRDFREKSVGHVLVLRDVTERLAYEQRLEVVNRLLRHNLRNSMTVIMGQAERVVESEEGDMAELAEDIRETARNVAEFGDDARRIDKTLDSFGDTSTVDVARLIDSVISRHRRDDEKPNFKWESQSPVWVRAPDAETLRVAIDDLVENAIEHNDRSAPTVEVRIDQHPRTQRVTVRIADDGPGIPAVEREVLAEGEETDLRHGSGLGLWLVQWVAEASGGSLTFSANQPRGTVAELTLPMAEPSSKSSPNNGAVAPSEVTVEES